MDYMHALSAVKQWGLPPIKNKAISQAGPGRDIVRCEKSRLELAYVGTYLRYVRMSEPHINIISD